MLLGHRWAGEAGPSAPCWPGPPMNTTHPHWEHKGCLLLVWWGCPIFQSHFWDYIPQIYLQTNEMTCTRLSLLCYLLPDIKVLSFLTLKSLLQYLGQERNNVQVPVVFLGLLITFFNIPAAFCHFQFPFGRRCAHMGHDTGS